MGHGNLLKVFVVADINGYLHFSLYPTSSQFSVGSFKLAVGSYRK